MINISIPKYRLRWFFRFSISPTQSLQRTVEEFLIEVLEIVTVELLLYIS
ncbi:hypothetical protein CEAn_00049 [Coxiella endosymbiont of Amblyomma nuttalli]|nr:hypothetical protein CEAn_00049 [Coxiella endosymbiont of Amblyomma nuttalli]